MKPATLTATALLLFACAASSAPAQEATNLWQGAGPKPPPGRPGGWSIGAGATYSTSPYEGVDEQFMALPMISYVGRRIMLAGPQASCRLFDWRALSLSAELRYDFAGYDADDSQALNGMADRDGSLVAGGGLAYRLPAGVELDARFLSDVLDRYNGPQADATLSRSFRFGRWMVAPAIGLQWLCYRYAGYYYGVRSAEATPQRPAYEPGSAFNGQADLRFSRRCTDRLMLVAALRLRLLDREIRDSPIVSEDLLLSGFAGVSWRL